MSGPCIPLGRRSSSQPGNRGLVLVLLLLFCLLPSCDSDPLSRDYPITLTMWHVYGAQTESPMNDLVERFNRTEGKERGIVIEVTSVSNSTAIHSALVSAARLQPGSGDLPDLFVCYPKTLAAMGSSRALDWNAWFSEKEKEAFVPGFLEEGVLDGGLRVFPITKSTNILYVNASIFDKFSRDTGVTYADLATWEGMFSAADKYYQWSGGKAFFKYDDWLHYFMINTEALGGSFFSGGSISWESPVLKKIWTPLARAALKGEVNLSPGYCTKAMMIGETVCGIGSSASVMYFKDTVTFADNTTVPLRLVMLPVPLFRGAKPLAIQRGVGLCALKSTPDREYAASIFCRWLASEDINLPFAIRCGYYPVTKKALGRIGREGGAEFPDNRHRDQYKVMLDIYANSSFYRPPVFEGYAGIEFGFASAMLDAFGNYRKNMSSGNLPPDFTAVTMEETARNLSSRTGR